MEKSERTEKFDHFPVAAVEALGFVLLSHFTQAHKLDAKELLLIPVFAGQWRAIERLPSYSFMFI